MNLRTGARLTIKNEVVALKKLTTDRVLVPLRPLYTWIGSKLTSLGGDSVAHRARKRTQILSHKQLFV